MKSLLLKILVLLFCMPYTLNSQISKLGYIIKTDGILEQGNIEIMYPPEAFSKCRFFKENVNEIVEFSPADIKEYGIINGARYISVKKLSNNTTDKVFLHQLVKGKICLYHYTFNKEEHYYISKNDFISDSSLIEINKPTFKDTLLKYMYDFENIRVFLKDVRYNKTSLLKKVESYNSYYIVNNPTKELFSPGLIISDSLYDQGYIVNNRELNKYLCCGFLKTPFSNTQFFSPYHLREYIIEDENVSENDQNYGANSKKRHFVSREILVNKDTCKVFLELLASNEQTNLYVFKYYNGIKFFIEQNSSVLVEINSKNMKDYEFMQNVEDLFSECPKEKGVNQGLVVFKKKYMKSVVKSFNDCDF